MEVCYVEKKVSLFFILMLLFRVIRAGLDYRHGTGHGVGAFLNVHEKGVVSISYVSIFKDLMYSIIIVESFSRFELIRMVYLLKRI